MQQILIRFVDDPKDAVQGTDHLLAKVLDHSPARSPSANTSWKGAGTANPRPSPKTCDSPCAVTGPSSTSFSTPGSDAAC
jgi:hypothetical protein